MSLPSVLLSLIMLVGAVNLAKSNKEQERGTNHTMTSIASRTNGPFFNITSDLTMDLAE